MTAGVSRQSLPEVLKKLNSSTTQPAKLDVMYQLHLISKYFPSYCGTELHILIAQSYVHAKKLMYEAFQSASIDALLLLFKSGQTMVDVNVIKQGTIVSLNSKTSIFYLPFAQKASFTRTSHCGWSPPRRVIVIHRVLVESQVSRREVLVSIVTLDTL